jgi:hypothetical protein
MSNLRKELLAKMHLTIPPLDEDVWYRPDGGDRRHAEVSDVASASFCVLSPNNVKTPVVCLQPWEDRHGSTLGVWAIPPTRANQKHRLIKNISWDSSYDERFQAKYQKRLKDSKPPPETGDLFSERS